MNDDKKLFDEMIESAKKYLDGYGIIVFVKNM